MMPFKNPHPLYHVWRGMIDRCYNEKRKSFKNYGARGIKICPEWRHDFHRFVNDMGPRPNGFSLDRINNDGDYTPLNCRWASRTVQQRNQTVTRTITINGVTYIAAEIAEEYGFKTDTIVKRAKSVNSFDELVSPIRKVFKPGLALGGNASGAKKKSMTHCKNGHEFTDKNTLISKEGWRSCKECHRLREIIRRAK